MAIKRNLHIIDIIARVFIGAILIYVGFIDSGYVGNDVVRWLLGTFGIINVAVAILRFCPIYALAGIHTFRQ